MEVHMARTRLLSILTVILVIAPANAETYRDSLYHFDFARPGVWTHWPATSLNSANQFARKRAPGPSIAYLAVSQPTDNLLGTYPYMLIQVQKHKSANSSYEEIERGLTQATRSSTRELQ